MSELPSTNLDPVPTLPRHLDQVCDRFERAWRSTGASDPPPRIEDYLPAGVAGTEQAALLAELIALDVAYRKRRGEVLHADHYRDRFPDLDEAALAQALAALPGACPEPAPPPTVLEAPPGDEPDSALLGRRIGPYLIEQRVGRGGMGSVYRALREDTYRQQVALKVVRPGLDGAEVLRRFQTERQVLAELPHPHIARLLDGGTTSDGRPYLVMEYIDGESLDRYCERRQLGTRERVQLLQAVCAAVQHAHEHGVLHRDLKPGNVLVTADGTVKVTDFGLAKRLESGPDGSVPTPSGAVLGTPNYMAPEQAGGEARRIGPAVDVYSLGAILYELLTGRPPFRGETPLDTLWQVLTEQPVPPSRLHPRLPRNLETICLKCLEKDPQKRYPSVRALAGDLGRFLEGKPVTARPVGWLERSWRWCRRKPALAAASGLALVAGGVALLVSLLFAIHEYRAAERIGQEQKKTAAALRESQQRAATLALDQGLSLCERGEVGRGMLWLVRSLELAPKEAVDLRRVIRINLSGWRTQLRVQRQLLRGPALVCQVGFHPNGKLLLTAFEDGTVQLWDAATGDPVGQVMRHEKAVEAFACSRDHKLLATAGNDRTARLWDAATGRPIGKPLGHPDRVRALIFSPDGKVLLTGCHDGVCRFWEVATGLPVGEPLRHDKGITTIAYSPDGKTILSGSERTARLWDADRRTPVGDKMRHREAVGAAVFSPDGKMIVTGSLDHTARRWDAATGKPLAGEPMQHLGWEEGRPADVPARVSVAVAISPDSKKVLTGGDDGTARLWDAASGKPLTHPLRHPDWIADVAFSPDGRSVLTACADGNARLWDAATGQPLGPPFPYGGGINQVAFSPDGATVLLGGNDRTARLWETTLPRSASPPLIHLDGVLAGAFSPDGRLAVTAGKDRTVRLWDSATGQPLGKPLPHLELVPDLAFSPDGKTLATATRAGALLLWDVAARKLRFDPPPRHQKHIYCVTFSPDGRTVLTGSHDGTARLWDVATGQQRALLPHGGNIYKVAYSPDNRIVATGSSDHTARLWDAATGKFLGLVRHAGAIQDLAFSPDGRLLATASSDGTARLWDVASQQACSPPLEHQTLVWSLAFSPDGKLLLTGSDDRTARLWHVATGQQASPPLVNSGGLSSVAFSPDGRTVLTGGHDGTARLWDVATGKPLGPPLRHRKDIRRVVYRPDGRRVLTASMDGTARLWDVPEKLEGDVERLKFWVEVSSGMELATDGSVRWLEAQELRQRRQRLQKLGGPPLH
jgi:WD40 repeat protein